MDQIVPRPIGASSNTEVDALLTFLMECNFEGDVEQNLSQRMVAAVDNSIYRMLPAAVLFPKNQTAALVAVKAALKFKVPIIARGGATGTNGQSLGTGVVLDMSRHMNRILDIDTEKGSARVEAGVVLDQLNAELEPLGLFFAPSVSTSSRATIGGMFATDASGKGSRRYGRTSDHVRSIKCITADGTLRVFGNQPEERDDWLHKVERSLNMLLAEYDDEIKSVFPDINRGLTGYNLRDAKRGSSSVDLIKLLSGSEGTLAVTTELELNLCKIPTQRALAIVGYEDSLSALKHVSYLLASDPLAIEFVDDKIVENARNTPLWSGISSLFANLSDSRGFLFVEYSGFDQSQVDVSLRRLESQLSETKSLFDNYMIETRQAEISRIWEMRKLAVGLIARSSSKRVGVPFVEDAAVPPENLAEFVDAFSAILERQGLSFGMYGHADVGCVHVRPMLDMKDASDRDKIRTISDQVSELCQKHGGLIWGEHGKGVRGEYVREYVGEALYIAMAKVKRLFDPLNLFNPGKIVGPSGKVDEVYKIDSTPFRGARDEQIDLARFGQYKNAVSCNGNGACHNWSANMPMCPSYKATRDRSQGPQGRSILFREHARQMSLNYEGADAKEIEKALFDSLSTCLSCKSCTGQCPVQIDIPKMKSHFLAAYYKNRRRPLRDILVRHLESSSILGAKFPRIANTFMNAPVVRKLFSNIFHLSDLPEFAYPSTLQRLQKQGLRIVDDGDQLEIGSVCILSDSFLTPFDPSVVSDAARVLQVLGHEVAASQIVPLGKALDVRGFNDARAHTLKKARRFFAEAAKRKVKLITLEPSVFYDLRELHESGTLNVSNVQIIEQFLIEEDLGSLRANNAPALAFSKPYRLILHCTERSINPKSAETWGAIFKELGLPLLPHDAGCCGMAGLFGHESEHKVLSKKIFDLSWRAPVVKYGDRLLSTGFSCRSQTKRFAAAALRHPVQILASELIGGN